MSSKALNIICFCYYKNGDGRFSVYEFQNVTFLEIVAMHLILHIASKTLFIVRCLLLFSRKMEFSGTKVYYLLALTIPCYLYSLLQIIEKSCNRFYRMNVILLCAYLQNDFPRNSLLLFGIKKKHYIINSTLISLTAIFI